MKVLRGCSAVVLTLVLLAACATDTGDEEPGAEVTGFTDPAEEQTTAGETSEAPGPEPVALELPSLPIGGDGAFFTEPSTQCADITLSEITPPGASRIVITGFTVAEQFTIEAGQCGDGPPCLGGHEFSSDGAGCQVAVTWTGAPVEAGHVELGVSSATAACSSATECDQLVAAIEAAGLQTVTLTVDAPVEEESE